MIQVESHPTKPTAPSNLLSPLGQMVLIMITLKWQSGLQQAFICSYDSHIKRFTKVLKLISSVHISTLFVLLAHKPGKGKGYPLQYPGQGNSMDCIPHEVTKIWTQLFWQQWREDSLGKRQRKSENMDKALRLCYFSLIPNF